MNEIFRTTQISYQNCVVLAYSVTYDLGYNSLNPLPNHQTYIENIIVYFPQWKPVFASQISPPSVQFSHSVVSNSLQPHGRQRAKLPCPSPTPGAYTNSCPLSQWSHPTISSSVIPFSSCLQSFPASGKDLAFLVIWFFVSVAKVLELPFQYQSFQWIVWVDFL